MAATRTHFAFRIDLWTSDGASVVEHLAGAEDFQLALATYRAAVALAGWAITLRQGARVIEDADGLLMARRRPPSKAAIVASVRPKSFPKLAKERLRTCGVTSSGRFLTRCLAIPTPAFDETEMWFASYSRVNPSRTQPHMPGNTVGNTHVNEGLTHCFEL